MTISGRPMSMLPKIPAEIVDVYRRAITPRTKVISMCHVVNTNAMILPVKALSEMARERGIQANTMGMSSQFDPLNQLISRLGPLSDMAGRTVSTSGVSRDRASPADMALGLVDAIFPG